MEDLNEYFDLLIAADKMSASIHMLAEYNPDELSEKMMKEWLASHKIIFGYNEDNLQKLTKQCDPGYFPINVATGVEPKHGVDGKIDFVCDRDDYFGVDEKRDFRDVKKIPSLTSDEKIAIITDPIPGKAGRDIFGKNLPAKKGRPIKMIAGKNVRYDEQSKTFYAMIDGQLSIAGSKIHIFDTYEISGDLTMQTGNIDFIGSVTIRGNVPSGYRVKADGDIQIYGLVEASQIEAGGNITITEGISGLKKGTIKAGGNVNIGYINQANVDAENNIVVQNSIMHSHCVAKEHIFCQSGNIVGGVCSAGVTIVARDVGNRMDTKTEIAIGIDQEQFLLETKLELAKKTLLNDLEKLKALGAKLENKAKSGGLTQKERILLLKQRNTIQVTESKLSKIDTQIESLHVQIGDEEKARLIVKGTMYPNVNLRFGKYQKSTTTNYKFTQVYIKEGEIQIIPL
ncbi:DUF342 domain-containing protein [Amphibacillus sediminis]|uniref:DUF342 domain-containing protein n=1 Tax=Amphibacillus sediminis TaxID=360185 RepID=UPI0008358D52|nr:FapA family protein [Amphibacillus sediminis]